MTATALPTTEHDARPRGLAPLALGALGVVYGDIGTSPLYTMKEVFGPSGVPDSLAGDNTARTSGRGLFLMRAYMSGVSFNPRGNRVSLWRRRSEG